MCRFILKGSAVKAEPFIYFVGIGAYGGALPRFYIFRKTIDYSNASEKGSYILVFGSRYNLTQSTAIEMIPQGKAG